MRAAALAGCPGARLLSLGVFGAGLSTDAATVAAALDRAAALGAEVALCAFGMGRRDEAIAAACARLLAAGTAVVAAAPARGEPCWPAALPGVASVQGTRCGPGEWSALGPPAPDWGACPVAPGHEGAAGSSTAAAHFAGLLAARMAVNGRAAALDALRRSAAFQGESGAAAPARDPGTTGRDGRMP